MHFAYMLHSMSELSEAFQNLNLYPVPIEVSHNFTGYIADIEEPLEFQAPPLEKAKPKKRRRYVGWRKVRRRKPRRIPKIENPVSVSKGKRNRNQRKFQTRNRNRPKAKGNRDRRKL